MPSYAKYCTKANYIYSNLYSDIYRAKVRTKDGTEEFRDIVHIRLPFSKTREETLKARYNLDGTDLLRYYKTFSENLKHGWKIEDALRRGASSDYAEVPDNTAGPDNVSAGICALAREDISVTKAKGQQGSDIYIVRQISDPVTGGEMMTRSGISSHRLLELGLSLIEMAEVFNRAGAGIGCIEPEELCLVTDRDGERRIRPGSFRMAGIDNERPLYTPEWEAHMHPEVLEGKRKPDLDTDLYSVCSLLLTMLASRHFSLPTDTARKPEYAPDGLHFALINVMRNGAPALPPLKTALRQSLENDPDRFIVFLAPPEGYPDYSPEEHIGDTLAKSSDVADSFDYDAYDDYEESPQRSRPKNRRVIAAAAVFILAVSAAAAAASFKAKAPEFRPCRSGDDGLYLYETTDGQGNAVYMMVDRNGAGERVYIDGKGNAYAIETVTVGTGNETFRTGEALYPAENLDPFIPIENISVCIDSVKRIQTEHNISTGEEHTLEGSFICSGAIEPENALPDRIYTDVPDGVGLFDDEGNEVQPGTGISIREDGSFSFELRSAEAGECRLAISDGGGIYRKELTLRFEEDVTEFDTEPEKETDAAEIPQPETSPVPEATPSPAPSAAPAAASTPAPVITYTPAPVQTPNAGIVEEEAFGVNAGTVTIGAGETYRIATTGDDGGSIRVWSTDVSVATVCLLNDIDGEYTIEGVGAGECFIIFRAASGDEVRVQVRVV